MSSHTEIYSEKGYYRTNYPKKNWELIIEQLLNEPTAIHPANRAQLITDSHMLAIDGKLWISIPLGLTMYLQKEEDPLVWTAALEQFKIFYSALDLKTRPIYKEHFLKCLRHEYRRINFETSDDDRQTRIWKSKMLQFLCWLKEPECVEKVKSMYRTYGNKLLEIDPDLQYVILCTMIREQKEICENLTTGDDISTRMRTISFKFLCQRKVFDQSVNCIVDQGIYSDLANVISKELRDKRMPHIEKYMKAILSHWDTTIFVLKSIQYVLSQWSNKSPSSAEIEGLTKAIRYLHIYGRISGNPEVDTLDEMVRWMDKSMPQNKYQQLKEALSNVRLKATRVGRYKIDESVLVSLLPQYRCEEIKRNIMEKPLSSEEVDEDSCST